MTRQEPPPRDDGPEPQGLAPDTVAIDLLLAWIAGEMRAELAFPWYRSYGPCRFIARCPPGRN